MDTAVKAPAKVGKLTRLPMGCRMADNATALRGGFRLREGART